MLGKVDLGLSHRSEASAWPEPPLPCKAGGGRREARTGSEPGGLECHRRAEAEPRALEAGSSATPDRGFCVTLFLQPLAEAGPVARGFTQGWGLGEG